VIVCIDCSCVWSSACSIGSWGHPLRHWGEHRRQSEQCANRRLAYACARLLPLVYLACTPAALAQLFVHAGRLYCA